MYTLRQSTELMKNQKAAQLLSDQSAFDALQTADGGAVLFGIGDAGSLSLTRELQGHSTGWAPVDLTAELQEHLPGLTLRAKDFAVSQDPNSGDMLIAQVVHTAEDGQDHVFILQGLSHDPAATWFDEPSERVWLARPYDDQAHPTDSLVVSYVRLEPSQDTGQMPYLVAGVAAPQTSYISTYMVGLDPTTTTGVWQSYPTAEDFTELVGMAIGMNEASGVFGLYQLYTLSGQTSLTFTPSGSDYPDGPVITSKMVVPPGASALTVVPVDAAGYTNLYVAGSGAIYLFPPGQQDNTGVPAAVISNPVIDGVTLLEAGVSGGLVTLWARNADGTVYYSRCPVDQQSDPAAWSTPIPIGEDAEQVASLTNVATGARCLFLHTGGANVQVLTQDPVTTQWSGRALPLPTPDVTQVYETFTFTTHIDVLDDNGMPSPTTAVPIRATSPVAVYVNDLYTSLSQAELTVQATALGSLTLVQETQTLGAVCYTLTAGDGTPVTVNPMAALLTTVGTVHTGTDLTITVSDEQGNTQPLLPDSVTSAQRDAVAQCLQQLVGVGSTMPEDGSMSDPPSQARSAAAAASATTTFGLSFAGSDVQYISAPVDTSGAIEGLAGDVLRWLEQVVDDVVQFVVQVADDVAHFFVTIGEDLYHFVLACASDVMHGIQFVFTKIGVAFDTLVKWLGFIFAWHDILRTHQVAKNFLSCYIDQAIANLSTVKDELTTLSTDLQGNIATWTQIPPATQTLGGEVSAAGTPPGGGSPASTWGTHHLQSNAAAATTTYSAADADTTGLEDLMSQILQTIATEGKDIGAACAAIKTQVVDQICTLSASEIIKRLIGILADLVVETLVNLVIDVVDILQAVVSGVRNALDHTISIPVLSWAYQKFAQAPLSFLDLACLISAIPATVVYKATYGSAPFPDDATTTALTNAPDFSTFLQILNAPTPTEATSALAVVPLTSAADRWKFTANVLALAGSVGVGTFSALKIYNPNNPVFAVGHAVCYLPYCAPCIGVGTAQTWDEKMNEALAALAVAKATADIYLYRFNPKGANNAFLTFWQMASPPLDFAISGCWMLPAIFPLARGVDLKSIVTMESNVSFNCTGIIGLVGTLDPEDISKAVFTAMVVATIAIYGVGIFTTNFLADIR